MLTELDAEVLELAGLRLRSEAEARVVLEAGQREPGVLWLALWDPPW